ncbi:hypothetical protein FBUS_04906 [Fasciolopsis buskii]|uniref:Uncharacterized protein n=1 Tax=Fasciolopsis buskii TaxID=27845 RepID=A0A8E0RVY8_9TREM|nr:hypothetical protein FBUS_04906 [Fasciolopsis buski]
MTEKRTFLFDAPDSAPIQIEIQTICDADLTVQYGHYTWRSAEALATYLAMNPSLLGCGTGLCGLVSALLGASHVTFTDADRSVEANLIRNAEVNKVTNYTFHELDWKDPCYKWKIDPFEVLLASDCLFDKGVYETFIRTASFLLHTRPGSFMLTSVELRG